MSKKKKLGRFSCLNTCTSGGIKKTYDLVSPWVLYKKKKNTLKSERLTVILSKTFEYNSSNFQIILIIIVVFFNFCCIVLLIDLPFQLRPQYFKRNYFHAKPSILNNLSRQSLHYSILSIFELKCLKPCDPFERAYVKVNRVVLTPNITQSVERIKRFMKLYLRSAHRCPTCDNRHPTMTSLYDEKKNENKKDPPLSSQNIYNDKTQSNGAHVAIKFISNNKTEKYLQIWFTIEILLFFYYNIIIYYIIFIYYIYCI